MNLCHPELLNAQLTDTHAHTHTQKKLQISLNTINGIINVFSSDVLRPSVCTSNLNNFEFNSQLH